MHDLVLVWPYLINYSMQSTDVQALGIIFFYLGSHQAHPVHRDAGVPYAPGQQDGRPRLQPIGCAPLSGALAAGPDYVGLAGSKPGLPSMQASPTLISKASSCSL